ncbi:hypothetical protein [Helicobacter sp. MIT 14-3879]|nr:hypothetical protein [Helicobacter sp. MIT 14-3879]
MEFHPQNIGGRKGSFCTLLKDSYATSSSNGNNILLASTGTID